MKHNAVVILGAWFLKGMGLKRMSYSLVVVAAQVWPLLRMADMVWMRQIDSAASNLRQTWCVRMKGVSKVKKGSSTHNPLIWVMMVQTASAAVSRLAELLALGAKCRWMGFLKSRTGGG